MQRYLHATHTCESSKITTIFARSDYGQDVEPITPTTLIALSCQQGISTLYYGLVLALHLPAMTAGKKIILTSLEVFSTKVLSRRWAFFFGASFCSTRTSMVLQLAPKPKHKEPTSLLSFELSRSICSAPSYNTALLTLIMKISTAALGLGYIVAFFTSANNAAVQAIDQDKMLGAA
jgi:hypothetical protein